MDNERDPTNSDVRSHGTTLPAVQVVACSSIFNVTSLKVESLDLSSTGEIVRNLITVTKLR